MNPSNLPLRKIAFLTEDFQRLSPAQQLLDRLLIGYPRNGEFHRLEGCQFAIHVAGGSTPDELNKRARDFGLSLAGTISDAVRDADGLVIVGRLVTAPNTALVRAAIESSPRGARCFVYGALASTAGEAQATRHLAEERGVLLSAGTATATTYRVPPLELPIRAAIRDALIVVQGPAPVGELEALQGLLPFLEQRAGGERGVNEVQFARGDLLWAMLKQSGAYDSLLAAAISRSNNVQGDALRDGRTQDIVKLGLIQTLAPEARGWLLRHRDGVQSWLLVLDGALADYNVAIRLRNGAVHSTQLFRPPAPMNDQFSPLTARVEDYFRSGIPPWPAERDLLVASLLERFGRAESR